MMVFHDFCSIGKAKRKNFNLLKKKKKKKSWKINSKDDWIRSQLMSYTFTVQKARQKNQPQYILELFSTTDLLRLWKAKPGNNHRKEGRLQRNCDLHFH